LRALPLPYVSLLFLFLFLLLKTNPFLCAEVPFNTGVSEMAHTVDWNLLPSKKFLPTLNFAIGTDLAGGQREEFSA
jgi:hypothetical protein